MDNIKCECESPNFEDQFMIGEDGKFQGRSVCNNCDGLGETVPTLRGTVSAIEVNGVRHPFKGVSD